MLRLLLVFAHNRTGKPPSRLDVGGIDATLVAAFLTHLETERGNSVSIRNTRLTAIHSPFRYAALRHHEHAESIQRVLAIPAKRHEQKLVCFLPHTWCWRVLPVEAAWVAVESLDRLGLDYVDIFYSHRIDPTTPLEETIGALDTAVRAGKARYVGISSYSATKTAEAAAIAQRLGTPLVIHQPSYSMLNRWIEGDLIIELNNAGMGAIAFTALAQGLLTNRYLDKPATDVARATERPTFDDELVTDKVHARLQGLAGIARQRGQSLAQLALAWVLRDPTVASTLVGASSVAQLKENLGALDHLEFTPEDLSEIDRFASDSGIDLWRESSDL